LPLDKQGAVPFRSPDSLRVELHAPHAGTIAGMGIPTGVTLIVGGGFHGKSTLLNAVETGVYNHVPGDGRERCVSDRGAAKVRAYDGRPISEVDISMLIGSLPNRRDTSRFSTSNSSGSTSQAASIAEALEIGATALLMDEDTCASNLMSRDDRMRALVRREDEPITTFVSRVRWLLDELSVSSVLVMGGSGDYFGSADTVIQMVAYEPRDVTDRARAIGGADGEDVRGVAAAAGSPPPSGTGTIAARSRLVHTASIDPRNEHGKISVYATEPERIRFGRTTVDLTDVEQIVELSQTKAIAQAMLHCTSLTGSDPIPLTELVRRCQQVIAEHGLDGLCKRISGDLAEFRGIELAAALNRLRGIEMEQV
jgi:predicted ABC-class ATPase